MTNLYSKRDFII